MRYDRIKAIIVCFLKISVALINASEEWCVSDELFKACVRGNEAVVYDALKEITKSQIKECLSTAITFNQPRLIRLILENSDVSINEPCTVLGGTLLHQAVSAGNKEITKILIERHANPKIKNRCGNSPIDLVIKNVHNLEEPKRRILLSLIAPEQLSPLFLEESHKKERELRECQELHEACRRGDLILGLSLLRRGVNPNAKYLGELPIDTIISSIHQKESFLERFDKTAYVRFAEKLLSFGARTNCTSNGIPLLASAIFSNQIELVQLLVEYGANPRLKGTRGKDCIDRLMNHQISHRVSLENEIAFLFILAAKKELLNRLSLCLEKKSISADYHILHACITNNSDYLEKKLPKKCPKKTIFELGNYLHIATLLGNIDLVFHLLKKNQSYQNEINSTESPLNRTPLHNAVLAKNPTLVRFLLDHGADGSKKDIFGNSPADMLFKYKPMQEQDPAIKSRLFEALGSRRIVHDEAK